MSGDQSTCQRVNGSLPLVQATKGREKKYRGGEKEDLICIGIDVHKKKCVATLKRDSSKQIIEQTSFNNTSQGICEFMNHVKQFGESATAVCESTSNFWIRLHDTFEDNGINTILAHPTKAKIIAQARLKDDKLDSNNLADLLRADLVCESYVPDKEYREMRQLVRTRTGK